MKVVHVTTVHNADDVRIYERECKSLSSHGYDVTLAAHGNIDDSHFLTFKKLKDPSPNRLYRILQSQITCWKLFRECEGDIWHFHDPELLVMALYLSLVKKKKVVWDAHEDYIEQFSNKAERDWIPNFLKSPFKFSLILILKAIDKIASGVIGATLHITSLYSNPNTFYVGNEVRMDDFLLAAPDFSSNRVLYLGAMGENYCFLDVVKAVSKIPRLTLVVAGRPSFEEEWGAAVSILGERIVHLGWLNRKELVDEFNRSSIGIVSYANSNVTNTNSPTKLYEFAAGGLPIVATPTQSNTSRLAQSKNGLISNSFEPVDIACAIESLLSDHERWKIMSSSGRLWVKTDANWSASEARLFALYNRIGSLLES
jgi:glycosyltransferase involved in cell wall biosynthesis